MKKFVFLVDLHYGYERDVYRHKKPMHSEAAMNCALSFVQHFKPDELILGGDILDCAAISHHNKKKPAQVEGLRLQLDAEELRTRFIEQLALPPKAKKHYIIGNHEDWLGDLVDETPGLEGLVSLEKLLQFDSSWNVRPQGGHINLGKLTFLHGDQLRGGEYAAKAAVVAYERSVRFGHFHTYQAYTKTSALDIKLGRTGVIVPCLCSKAPKYGEGAPNRWVQGLNYGYIHADGTYNDYVAIITNGKTCIDGRIFKG